MPTAMAIGLRVAGRRRHASVEIEGYGPEDNRYLSDMEKYNASRGGWTLLRSTRR